MVVKEVMVEHQQQHRVHLEQGVQLELPLMVMEVMVRVEILLVEEAVEAVVLLVVLMVTLDQLQVEMMEVLELLGSLVTQHIL